MRWISRSRGLAVVVVLLALAAALSLAVGWTGGAGSRAAAAATEYDVAPETTAALADVRPGDRVNVVIQNKVPGAIAALITEIYFCDGSFSGVPSSGTCGTVRWGGASNAFWSDPDGRIEFTALIPAEGENIFPGSGSRPEISCEPEKQCSIGFTYLALDAGQNLAAFVTDVTSLRFTVKPALAISGCAAPQPDRLVDAVGPDRLADTEIAWAQDRCGGGRALDLDFSAKDEVSARDDFREGSGDVFFSAGGVTADENAATAGKRKSVPVPVALNAQVLAIHGAFPAPTGLPGTNRSAPLSDVKLTAEQIADVLTQPGGTFIRASEPGTPGPFAEQILATNPNLATLPITRRLEATIAAYSTRQVGHWVVSRYLEHNAPSAWRYPELPEFEQPTEPIGALMDLRPVFPAENINKVLVGDQVGLRKLLEGAQFDQECNPNLPGCANFVLTDLATANELRLPVVQVETVPGGGRFVAPTPESMAAAIDDMEALPDGSLVPDLDKQDPNAYPFTFVEYANAPAEQFLDDECQPTGKLQVVRDVLSYLVTDGQGQLAKGLVPLPGEMGAQAASATQKVGAEVPARCATGSSDGDQDSGGGDDLAGAALLGSGAGNGATAAGAVGDHPTRPVTTAGQQQALNAADNAAIPLFAGMAALVLLVPLSALALTNGLTSGTAFGSAGRRLPPRVAGALTAAGASLRRLMRR